MRVRLLIILLSTFLYGYNIKTYIPVNAKKYDFDLYQQVDKYLPGFKEPWYFSALAEHESCITLTSKRCWSPKSRLKTRREEGAGIPQLTRVFRKDGTVRWDVIETLRKRHWKELHELTWKNVYTRPDLQLRAMVILWRDTYNYFSKSIPVKSRVWFADSAYNGGFKWLNVERKKCKLVKGCNPKLWFNNVEKMKSRRAIRKLYGNRTAWDINRHHVSDVRERMDKYKKRYKRIEAYENVKNLVKDLYK